MARIVYLYLTLAQFERRFDEVLRLAQQHGEVVIKVCTRPRTTRRKRTDRPTPALRIHKTYIVRWKAPFWTLHAPVDN